MLSGIFLNMVDFPVIWDIRGKSGKIDNGSKSYEKSGLSRENLENAGIFWVTKNIKIFSWAMVRKRF